MSLLQPLLFVGCYYPSPCPWVIFDSGGASYQLVINFIHIKVSESLPADPASLGFNLVPLTDDSQSAGIIVI